MLGRMKHVSYILLLSAMISCTALAHEDTVLRVGSEGSISGIPAEFGDARLSVSGLEAGVPTVVLAIGQHENRLPNCSTQMIRSKTPGDIAVSASWYHDESILPYYLMVEFFDPGQNRTQISNSGFRYMFDLRTAHVISIEEVKKNWFGSGASIETVELPHECKIEP